MSNSQLIEFVIASILLGLSSILYLEIF